MISPTPRPDEQRLTEVLTQEASSVSSSPDALALIQRRVAVSRHPRRRTRLLAGSVSLVAAAALLVALVVGLRPTSAPQPVETPLPAPSTSYDAGPVRQTFDVLRPRVQDGGARRELSRETVTATLPFTPRQAMDALFHLKPLAALDASPLTSEANVVGSTTETPDALVLDMASVDSTTRPPTPAVGRVWVQAWVQTLQDAYRSEQPVLITVQGQPTTLYGVVDTARPIAADPAIEEVQDQRIYTPRDGMAVTSPVPLGASVGKGAFQWRVADLAGRRVEHATTIWGLGYSTLDVDLPPGRYTVTLSAVPDTGAAAFRQQITVDVVPGGGTPTPAPPVTDPPVTVEQTVPLYWSRVHPGSGALVVERRVRQDPAAMVQDWFRVPPAADGAIRTREETAVAQVASVTELPDRIVVDFSRTPAKEETRRVGIGFARSVQSIVGTSKPVTVTLRGRPSNLFGGRLLGGEAAEKSVEADESIDPQPARQPGRLDVVGRLAQPTARAVYYLRDAVTQDVVVQGIITGADPRTGRYAFSVAAPAGRYLLQVEAPMKQGDSLVMLVDAVVR